MKPEQFDIEIIDRRRPLVQCDNFTLHHKAITMLFGESGIGKSMIAKAIYGLLDPDLLTVNINGLDYRKYIKMQQSADLRKNGFFVFQEPSSHLNPLMKLKKQLNEGDLQAGLNEQTIIKHLWKSIDDRAVQNILRLYPKPHRPSGGEKQRILLAMSLKKIERFLSKNGRYSRTLFVFDEPTGSLDNSYRDIFLEQLFKYFELQPFSILFITHDYSIISRIFSAHDQMRPYIHFKELKRDRNDRVKVTDFVAKDYMTWLGRLKPLAAKPEASPKSRKNEVLRLESSFRIFDKNFTIFADPRHRKIQPLTIQRGDLVYLKAPSGVGKTTLAKITMGLIRAQKFNLKLGDYKMNEHTPDDFWRKHIWGKTAGMTFQHADEALNLEATVKETFGGLKTTPPLTKDKLKQELRLLFDNEINDAFLNKKVGLLSGGQKQRLNLLRTLILHTNLVIMDEPLNGLDFLSIKRVLEILDKKRRAGTAFLMISHNEEIFDKTAPADCIFYLKQTG